MSQANIENLRKANVAFDRRDWDAFAATMDPHVVVRADPSWPEWGYFGREAVVAWFRDVSESWGTQVDTDEIVDLGDRLLVRRRYAIRAPRSGIEGEQRFSQIATFREGHTILIEFFLEHERALEALEMRD